MLTFLLLVQYNGVRQRDKYSPFRIANPKLPFKTTNNIFRLMTLTSSQELRDNGNLFCLRLSYERESPRVLVQQKAH